MKLNRAGGLSHLRTDHLRAVLTDEGSKSFDALLKVIQRLVDGALQPSVIELLNLCILHPLVSSASKPDKRRPVTCVEFILKAMERYMYQQARPTLQPILEGNLGSAHLGDRKGSFMPTAECWNRFLMRLSCCWVIWTRHILSLIVSPWSIFWQPILTLSG